MRAGAFVPIRPIPERQGASAFGVDSVLRLLTLARMEHGFAPTLCLALHRAGSGLIAVLLSIILTVSLVARVRAETPNDFFKRDAPTFIVGTAGDEHSDRTIKTQAGMIRDLLFPAARIIGDAAVEVDKGPAAWPANPILYGGPHVNHLVAKLGRSLPFRMERGKLALGEQLFEGEEYRLITVIPARPADEDGPGYPEFLLYAGTGVPGVAEINGLRHGGEPILVGDEFGRLLVGNWQKTSAEAITAAFTQPRAPRIAWRTIDRKLTLNSSANALAVRVRFPQQVPAANDDDLVIRACLRGLEQAIKKLNVNSGMDLTIYVYPDLGSIASLTGQRGDGHAIVEARVLHVVRADAAVGGGLEQLLAHEGTHVLAYRAWGAAGTPMLGEGLAVWASGAYGRVSLADWKRRIQQPLPSVAELLGKAFRQIPENQSYPLAGIFVEMAVEKLGIANVRQHLYAATASSWESACKRAGTTPQAMETAFRAELVRR